MKFSSSAANHRPLGQPQNQPGADQRTGGEQFELLAEHAMVAALGFFDIGQIFFQVLLAEPGGGVEPLQLLRGIGPLSNTPRRRSAA